MAGTPQVETKFDTAPGVQLNERQRLLTGSVLDLFAGKATLEKLRLWKDDAVFEDPITIARGRDQYQPQWYGLKAAFSEIQPLKMLVTSAGNPITLDMKTIYKIKGIGKETTIESVVQIHVDETDGKITHVQDKWNGNLPEGEIANVRLTQLFSPFWWMRAYGVVGWWAFSCVWETRVWQAFRRLNAVSVPKMVSVPKSDTEEKK